MLLAAATLLAGCSSGQSTPSEASPTALTGDVRRVNEGGNVTVEVTWENPAATATEPLRFTVVMDTHSVNLDSYDLSQLALLRNDQGKEVTPERWDAPPGGHHRSGTLIFDVSSSQPPFIEARTQFIELVIRDVAEVKERSFRWEIPR